jgi:hypothetical protein
VTAPVTYQDLAKKLDCFGRSTKMNNILDIRTVLRLLELNGYPLYTALVISDMPMDDIRHNISSDSKRFIDVLRRSLRDKGYQTEKTYVHWIRRFILFHRKQHPLNMGATHINQFLSSLGHDRHCSPATQRIALNALTFLYRKHLQIELAPLDC